VASGFRSAVPLLPQHRGLDELCNLWQLPTGRSGPSYPSRGAAAQKAEIATGVLSNTTREIPTTNARKPGPHTWFHETPVRAWPINLDPRGSKNAVRPDRGSPYPQAFLGRFFSGRRIAKVAKRNMVRKKSTSTQIGQSQRAVTLR